MTIKQERSLTAAFLFALCLQLAHSVHDAWYAVSESMGSTLLFDQPTTLYAPNAYRVAAPALIRFISQTFHISDRTNILAASDLVAGFLALYLFYCLINYAEPANPKDRAWRILLFLALIQFPLAWVVYMQRPETLPSALYLAICLFALVKSTTNTLWLLPVLVASLCQAFLRADVAFIFGIGIILAGLSTSMKEGLRINRARIAAGGLIVLIAGTVQSYLQFIRYPNLTYTPGTKVIQIAGNLTLHNLRIFLIALFPFLAFFLILMLKRPRLNFLEKVVILSSALYMALWFTVGVVSEVRIFVPFLFALSMVMASSSPGQYMEYDDRSEVR